MDDHHSALGTLGIDLADSAASPDLYAGLYHAARRLRESRRKVVGLLPVNDCVALPPIAIQFASVLIDACQGAVVVIDANTRWPALGMLAPHAEPGVKSGVFCTAWLADFLVVMTPTAPTAPRLDLSGLEDAIRNDCEGYAHVLVDLTGFEILGEHWDAFRFLDGVLLVAVAGRTSEPELLSHQRDVPERLNLGVMLVAETKTKHRSSK